MLCEYMYRDVPGLIIMVAISKISDYAKTVLCSTLYVLSCYHCFVILVVVREFFGVNQVCTWFLEIAFTRTSVCLCLHP